MKPQEIPRFPHCALRFLPCTPHHCAPFGKCYFEHTKRTEANRSKGKEFLFYVLHTWTLERNCERHANTHLVHIPLHDPFCKYYVYLDEDHYYKRLDSAKRHSTQSSYSIRFFCKTIARWSMTLCYFVLPNQGNTIVKLGWLVRLTIVCF